MINWKIYQKTFILLYGIKSNELYNMEGMKCRKMPGSRIFLRKGWTPTLPTCNLSIHALRICLFFQQNANSIYYKISPIDIYFKMTKSGLDKKILLLWIIMNYSMWQEIRLSIAALNGPLSAVWNVQFTFQWLQYRFDCS